MHFQIYWLYYLISIIGNDGTDEQWAVVTVVLYSKKNVKMCEVLDFKSNGGNNFNKRSNRFYINTLVGSEMLNDDKIQ